MDDGVLLVGALGAAASPMLRRGLGLRVGYLSALGLVALCTGLLGDPGAAAAFVALYLVTYLSYGLIEPMRLSC